MDRTEGETEVRRITHAARTPATGATSEGVVKPSFEATATRWPHEQ